MPATGFEIKGSRALNLKSAKRQYRIQDANTEQDVLDFVLSLPATVAGLPFSDFSASERAEASANGDYDVEVTWGVPDAPQSLQTPGTSEYRFSFQAPAGHIVQSLSTINRVALAGFPLEDFNGLINVVYRDGQAYGEPEGIDLAPPPETFTLSYSAPNSVITGAYQLLVEGLCGKVNSTTFRGRAAGSIMLVRVNGGRTAENVWSIEFGFSHVANQTNIPVGGITVPSKDGHDLLWALNKPWKNPTAKVLSVRPVCAFVERVWQRANLNALGLP